MKFTALPQMFCGTLGAIVILFGVSSLASATTLVEPVANPWAGNPNTTSQSWTVMEPGAFPPGPTAVTNVSTAPATADTSTNSNGTAVWYDEAVATDGDINAGGDAYSFSGVLNPVAVVPGFNVSGNQLKVLVEVQFFGGTIDTGAPAGSADPGPNDPGDPTALTATYTDPSGTMHVNVPVNSLPGFSYNEVYNDGGSDFGGFGIAYQIDGVWEFTLPQDTSSLELSWDWGAVSSALQDMTIYTESVAAVPEPCSLWLAILGLSAVVALPIVRSVRQ